MVKAITVFSLTLFLAFHLFLQAAGSVILCVQETPALYLNAENPHTKGACEGGCKDSDSHPPKSQATYSLYETDDCHNCTDLLLEANIPTIALVCSGLAVPVAKAIADVTSLAENSWHSRAPLTTLSNCSLPEVTPLSFLHKHTVVLLT